MKNTIRIVLAFGLIVGTGLVNGAWTNRWRPSRELSAMAARLQSVPTTIGDRTATSTVLPANELSMTGAVGYFLRYYRNAKSGVTITALMLCGLLGMISTHTPDVCYAGAGYAITTRSLHQQTYGKPERRAHFRTATASRGGTSPSILRIFWGCNSSNG
jgi:Protein of unknown function (DUF3485)